METFNNLDNPLEKNGDLREITQETNNLKMEIEGGKMRYKKGNVSGGGGKEIKDIKPSVDSLKRERPKYDGIIGAKEINEGDKDLKKEQQKENPKNFNSLMQEKLKEEDARRAKAIWEKMKGPKPSRQGFVLGYIGYKEMPSKNGYLAIVDWTQNKGKERFYLINMTSGTPSVEKRTTCQQGTGNIGKETTKRQPGFSDVKNSYKTSLGVFQTWQSKPKNNFGINDSLVVSGKEDSNSNSADRHILVHKGTYSHGCFVLPKENKKEEATSDYILDKLKRGGTIMSYYPDAKYLANSSLLKPKSLSA